MMNQEVKISIIIPMFKVAKYLERCLKSLANQDLSFNDYEIICINDGSPDDCSEIVTNLKKEIPNIVLLEQQNQGVSMARNNGLAIAKGKYIMMIDADDYVVENNLKKVLETVEEKKCDVLYLGFENFDTDKKSLWATDFTNQEGKIYSGIEAYFTARGPNVKSPDRSWAILYRRELLDSFKITYPKDVPYLEDGLFLAKVCTVAKNVAFENIIFYQRIMREGSATMSNLFYTDKAINGFILAVQDIKQFAKENTFNKEQLGLINHTVAKYVLLTVTPSISSSNFKEYIFSIKKLKKGNIDKINVHGLRSNYKLFSNIFNISPMFFYYFFPFYNKIKQIIR